MSKSNKKAPKPRNNVAWGMIMAQIGKNGGPMKDQRNRRGKKDRQWRKDWED